MPSMTNDTLLQRFVRYAMPLVLGLLWCPNLAFSQAPAPVIGAPVTPLSVSVARNSDDAGPLLTQTNSVPEGRLEPAVQPVSMPVADSVIQLQEGTGAGEDGLSDPLVNVPGIAVAINPPDTVGDVGRNHFVQMVNATFYQVWDKAGNPLTPPLLFGNLWPVGERCRNNAGDPIVVYDHLADRWLLSQFADPNHMCFAISQTPDPTTGTWFLYTFDVGVFPDYPKIGVWPDGYYMTSYEGATLGVFAFQREAMLLGQPARFVKTTIPTLVGTVRDTRILPSDLDGPAPPAAIPNVFVRTVDDRQDLSNPIDRIEIYEARVNWSTPSFSFARVNTLFPAGFNTMACNRNGLGIRDCVPQPGTTATVDALSNRPMMQLKYRDFGSYQAMVFNQTIDVHGSIPGSVREVAGIRWYELRKATADWSIHQQGTYTAQPSGASESALLHRWMGSAAVDRYGNIAVGYSAGNSDAANPLFPGIRYTGRYADDPLGLLPEPERTIVNGTNAQTGGGMRWGDYSAMSVDPVDDCTFWYTTHVAGVGGVGARPSRIASFRFGDCAILSNDLVSFVPIAATFTTTSDTTGCPAGFAGTFSFVATLRNEDGVPLRNVAARAWTLTNRNLLKNADGGPRGVGATLTIQKTGSYTDGVLSPGEAVDVPFSICLTSNAPFTLLADVVGIH
jgi:hypothetical protein